MYFIRDRQDVDKAAKRAISLIRVTKRTEIKPLKLSKKILQKLASIYRQKTGIQNNIKSATI